MLGYGGQSRPEKRNPTLSLTGIPDAGDKHDFNTISNVPISKY